jgi:glycolate oxidase iron-sulfur subunit
MNPVPPSPSPAPPEVPPGGHFSNCTHCGFCLPSCPTYRLTGDENNSPRGRLRLWSEEEAGRLSRDPWTDFYTAECVGCLACETACPAHVPYGDLFEHVRRDHVRDGRFRPHPAVRLAAVGVARPRLFDLALLPARWARRCGAAWPSVPPGRPALWQSTAAYARALMERHRPTGPRVALLTGCLMEGLFREINFATVRVLLAHGCQVLVPETQTCCGAFQEHSGLGGAERLRSRNRAAFLPLEADAVVSNSSGCGLALGRALAPDQPVQDVLAFLGDLGPVPRRSGPGATGARVYVDLPCHLVHGQKSPGIPASVLDATGLPWELAPDASDCCGSGGVYHLHKPDNSRAILAAKAAFLETAAGNPVILASSNHVCLMQWHRAGALGLVKRPYQVRHVIELWDAGA